MIIEVIIMSLLGLVTGSFLSVCIYRMPEGKSINHLASYCMHCKHHLSVKDLIPVISYLALGGKCRYCGVKISKQYMGIELLNGLAYGLAIAYWGLNIEGIMMCTFISFMLILTLIDWHTMLLPTSIIQVGVASALLFRMGVSYREKNIYFLVQGILGGLVGYGILALMFFICLRLLKKEGMGYGDVRYLGMIGCFTSWQVVLLTLFLASIIGSVYGVIQFRMRQRSDPFPFGPFLSAGALIGAFYGEQLIRWYIGLI